MTTVIHVRDVPEWFQPRGRYNLGGIENRYGLPEGYVYIGRPSKWGNPWVVNDNNTREEAIASYREWFHSDHNKLLRKHALKELKDKILVCWCKPLACHGDVLAEWADAK
jgi:hypothetical protein